MRLEHIRNARKGLYDAVLFGWNQLIYFLAASLILAYTNGDFIVNCSHLA